jgi:transposase-like protein
MDQQEAIAEIEREAQRAGISIASLCKRHGVHPSTFSRWKRTPANQRPTSASYNDVIGLRATLKTMISERDSAHPKAAWA